MKSALVVSVTVSVLVGGLGLSAQTPELDGLRDRIRPLQGQIDKASPDPAAVAEVRSLWEQYNAATLVVGGAPPNNACANAIPIACNSTVAFDTTGASTDAPWSCALGGSDIWFTITGNGGLMTFDTCSGTAYDSALSAYTGSCGAFVEVTCNDDFCGLQSQISFVSAPATTYFIAVGGFLGGTGAGQLTVTCEVPVDLQSFDVE